MRTAIIQKTSLVDVLESKQKTNKQQRGNIRLLVIYDLFTFPFCHSSRSFDSQQQIQRKPEAIIDDAKSNLLADENQLSSFI
jgi:hypothetical protein